MASAKRIDIEHIHLTVLWSTQAGEEGLTIVIIAREPLASQLPIDEGSNAQHGKHSSHNEAYDGFCSYSRAAGRGGGGSRRGRGGGRRARCRRIDDRD